MMNLPIKLTVLRIAMIPVFTACFFVGFPGNRLIATAVFILAGFTDFLDGHIARKKNLITDLGKFLDPIADKMLVACALIAVVADTGPFQIGIAICSMIILCRELFVSGFRIVASGKNLVLAADKLGKIKTVLQICALILLLPAENVKSLHALTGNAVYYAGLILLAMATIMTVVSGMNYILKNRSVLKTEEK